MSYCGRYKGDDWIASAQYLAAGSLGASYWRRLTDKVEAGVDCQLQFQPGAGGGMFASPRKEGTTTIGVKYNFLQSVYRAQVDSAGKVGVVLEATSGTPCYSDLCSRNRSDEGKANPSRKSREKANSALSRIPTSSA